jgi:hypothetical protein
MMESTNSCDAKIAYSDDEQMVVPVSCSNEITSVPSPEDDADTAHSDDEQMDVPVPSSNTITYVPSAEERRTNQTEHHSDSKSSLGSNRFLKLLIAAMVVAAVLVVGVVIGVTSAGDSNGQPSPSGQGNSNPRGSNPQRSIIDTRESSIDEVIAIMANLGVSTLVALQTSGSPQNRAAIWLAETDGANLAVPTDFDTGLVELYKYITRYVMVVFYYSTLGETAWDSQVGFMTSFDVCRWYEKFLSGNQPYRKGVACDQETGLIIGLGISKWMRKDGMSRVYVN